MIKYVEKDGNRFINSIVLYKKMNMAPAVYSRWISKNIPFGVENKDYFLEKISHNGSHQEYLFTLEFARALCLVAKTSAAKKLRVFLFTL